MSFINYSYNYGTISMHIAPNTKDCITCVLDGAITSLWQPCLNWDQWALPSPHVLKMRFLTQTILWVFLHCTICRDLDCRSCVTFSNCVCVCASKGPLATMSQHVSFKMSSASR